MPNACVSATALNRAVKRPRLLEAHQPMEMRFSPALEPGSRRFVSVDDCYVVFFAPLPESRLRTFRFECVPMFQAAVYTLLSRFGLTRPAEAGHYLGSPSPRYPEKRS